MPIPTSILGIIFGLFSAITWGTGDFAGGYAARKQSQYQVLALSAISGLAFLVVAVLIFHESFPSPRGILFSIIAGFSGALGIAAFYRSLATGNAAVVAPTTAVVSTALPVIFSAFFEGLPSQIKLIGFATALIGIWLVSAGSAHHTQSKNGLWLAILAGVGFAGFFIFMGNVDPGKVLTPLIIARAIALITGLSLVLINRQTLPALTSNLPALLCGVLDVGGNLFFVLARQYTRLDVAAVLSSLGPAVTVVISTLILKEHVSNRQWLGVLVCLAAVVLITL